MIAARCAGAAGSILVHAAVIAMLLHATGQEKAPPLKHAPVAVFETDGNRLSGELRRGYGLACGGYHYDGIGITVNPGSGRVLDVGPATPAEAAGMHDNDVLLDPNQLHADMYPRGTKLAVRVLRDGVEITLTLVIGRICNE